MADSIYFVTALRNAPAVRERVREIISDENRFELAEDRWVVVYEGSAQELAEAAGIRGGEAPIGTGLVMSMTTYAGRAPTDLWDWLRSKGR